MIIYAVCIGTKDTALTMEHYEAKADAERHLEQLKAPAAKEARDLLGIGDPWIDEIEVVPSSAADNPPF